MLMLQCNISKARIAKHAVSFSLTYVTELITYPCAIPADPHSSLMLAVRITFPHFSMSWAISFPKSAGEPERTASPRSAS